MTWGPDDGREVLTHGSDEPPRRSRAVLVGLAVACAVGALVISGRGAPTGQGAPVPSPPSATGTPRTGPVVVAAVPPSRRELAGVWLVDEGEAARPSSPPLWMAFHLDGSFMLDSRGALLSEPEVGGRYRLEDGRLTLLVEDGSGCRPDDRLDWTVGILPTGRLEIRHASGAGRCRLGAGIRGARALEDSDMWRVSWTR
jgi:hypothetical protein